MKNSLSFIILLILCIYDLTYSQFSDKQVISNYNSFNVKLSLADEIMEIDVKEKTFTFSEHIDVSKPGAPTLPSKIVYLAIPPFGNASISNIKTESFKTFELKPFINPIMELKDDSIITYKKVEIDKQYLVEDIYPSKLIEIVGYNWIRDYYCAIIKINNSTYNWKNKELINFSSFEFDVDYDNKNYNVNNEPIGEFDKNLSSIILNYEEAKQFRSFQPASMDSTGNWIDYSKEYIKLKVDKDGIFRIGYDELTSYGLSVGMINPKSIKIYNKGIEIPIFVKGESDLVFNTDDYIEFYGTKNYGAPDYRSIVNIGQDYKNYWDRYTDTSFYWIQWEGSEGLRCELGGLNPIGINDTIKNHIVKLHFEKDERIWYSDANLARTQLPFWQEHKFWTWSFLDKGATFSLNFKTKNVVQNSLYKTIIRLKSNAGNVPTNTHKLGVGLNSSTYSDTIIINYKETKNFTSFFTPSALETNVLKLYNYPTQTTVNQVLLDWIDVEYFRENIAINDSLLITIPDTFTTKISIIKVDNINSLDTNIYVYKIYPEFKKMAFSFIASDAIIFADTIKAGDKFLIISNDFKYTPQFLYKTQFVNLRNSNNAADYIIISNKILQNSATNYKNFISSTYNLRTSLNYVDDIYDEFSYGYPSAEAIKEFLKYAFNNWTAPKPSYLLLAGDATYDYKDVMYSPNQRNNLVPSYGMPVSDVWYTELDGSQLNIQQMYVGRISANNDTELQNYLNKHQIYITKQHDDWNKSYLFFSGGDHRNPSELAQIKAANDDVFNNLVLPAPVGGRAKHFYKTVNPPSNFGPYPLEEVQATINDGGLFISYIGHSGTQTWDNGITSVEDIKNAFSNRLPLISDFGCSTGKFAEPDVDAFGELFVSLHPSGQGINYLGNSSLGYLTTSLRFPRYFYEYFLDDTIRTVGKVHFLAKVKQFNLTGNSDVNRVFNYCNLLFGDPIISLPIPSKPNFVIKNSAISLLNNEPNNLQDSLEVKLILKNNGSVINDSLTINIFDKLADTLSYGFYFKYLIPLYTDTIFFKIPIKNKAGEHLLSIELDKENNFPEILEDDNYAEINYLVYASSIRSIINDKYYSGKSDSIILLNAQYNLENNLNRINVEIADNFEFNNSFLFNKEFDSITTKLVFENLLNEKRYWWRARIDIPGSEWSEVFSFNAFSPNKWFLDKTFRDDVEFNRTYFDSTSSGIRIANRNNTLRLRSAGWLDGSFASIVHNFQEYIINSFFAGIATAIIDSATLIPSDIRYFSHPDSMLNYLDVLPLNTVVGMMVAADGAQWVLGWTPGTPIRNMIKTFGSSKIDSVMYRDSWCMIGKKGAPVGSVQEAFKKAQTGFVEIDTSKFSYLTEGSFVTPVIANSSAWFNVIKNDSIPEGSNIEVIPIAIADNGVQDTLAVLTFDNKVADISNIDSSYSKLKLLTKFSANQNFESPLLYSLAVNYKTLSELYTNYQTVILNKDSLIQGDSIGINFNIYNLGEDAADTFNVLLELVKPDNSTALLIDTLIYNLQPNNFINLSNTYRNSFYDGYGLFKYNIKIDADNQVKELYEDNNIYSASFKVNKDTATSVNEADVNVSFDGINIIDGDIVSSNPEINMIVNYPVWYPVNDSSSFEIFIDDIKFTSDNMILSYDTIKRSLNVKITPEFSSGEHYITIFLKNRFGKIEESARYSRFFNVYNEFKLLDVYNYPNPFKDKTNFTFNLTQNNVNASIKIFTIAGRLIRDIKLNYLLNVGFNIVEWDGKDEDGNEVSNGVYLYKVIIEKDGKTDTKIQKAAKVK